MRRRARRGRRKLQNFRKKVSGGKRRERRRWRMKRPERSAAVGKMQVRFDGRRICRVPQTGSLF